MPHPPALALSGGLLAVLLLMTGVWLASLVQRDVSLVDRLWGMAFVLLAWWYAATGPDPMPWPGLALLALVTVWGTRLSVYLTWRNWGLGEDPRYAAMRERTGPVFAWTSLVTVFALQGVLAWVIAMPLFAGLRGQAVVVPWAAVAGLGLWALGFTFEVVGDWQLARHRADPARRGRVLDTGLWRYTRHPNYFGDAALWWGYWLLAASVGGWWTVFGPALMTLLLLRVSGVTLLERSLARTKPGYEDYVRRTPAFVPWFPRPPSPR